MSVLGKKAGDVLHGDVGDHNLFAQLEVGELRYPVPRGQLDGCLIISHGKMKDVGQAAVGPDGHSKGGLIDLRDQPADADATTGLHVLDGAHHLDYWEGI